jgi:hypothetical protein
MREAADPAVPAVRSIAPMCMRVDMALFSDPFGLDERPVAPSKVAELA